MKMVDGRDNIDESSTKAVVFLHKLNDNKNRILLTSDDLIIIRKSKAHFYKLGDIKSLAFHERRLLLPLVAGGILTPLGIVAMFGNYFNPYLVVLLILTGIYLLYEGLNDRWSLTVHGFSNEENFPLFFVSDNLRAFVDFVNGHLPHANDQVRNQGYIYLVLPLDLWNAYLSEDSFDLGSSSQKAYTWQQWVKSGRDHDHGGVALTLDPLLAPLRIEYHYDQDSGVLRPHVYGNVPKGAVVEIRKHEI